MPESSTKSEVEARLHGTSASIRDRLDAIEEEVVTTGSAIRQYLRENPMVSVGGSLVAGLLVGWLISGGRKRRLSRTHRRLIENYVDAMRDEVRSSVAEGAEVGEAVREAFHNRAPLIVYGGENGDGGSWLRQGIDLALSAAVPLVVRSMLTGVVEPPVESPGGNAGEASGDAPIGEGIPTEDEYSAS